MNTITKFLSLKRGVISIKPSSKLSCADARILKGIRTVATLLCSMLPVCIVLVSQPAQAGNFTLNSSSNGNVLINSSADWITIRSVALAAQNHLHSCLTVASADVNNPGGNVGDQRYIFNVTIDNSNPPTDGTAERTLELTDTPGVDDPNIHPVSTNNVFSAAANVAHTFRFLGRKAPGAANTDVLDFTLSVLCIGG